MNDGQRDNLLVYALTRLVRTTLRRRRLVALISVLFLYYVQRRWRRNQEQRNLLSLAMMTARGNLGTFITYLASREPSNRKFWTLPRPQYWFDVILERRELDTEWPKHFRISRETFMRIVEIVSPELSTQNNFREATPVVKKVAAALWRLATGNAYRCIGVTLSIGTASAQKYTVEFCDLLYGKRSHFVKFPSDLTSVISEFTEKTKIPNVVGALDGSHIPIKEPGEDQESYANRKQRHSILHVLYTHSSALNSARTHFLRCITE